MLRFCNLQFPIVMVLFDDHGIAKRPYASAILFSGNHQPATQSSAGASSFVGIARLMTLPVFLVTFLLSTASHAQNVSCTCRYQGEDYGIGESICLKGSNGMRMATCSMVLNNTSWKFSNAPCPLTELDQSNPTASQSQTSDTEGKTNWRETAMFNPEKL